MRNLWVAIAERWLKHRAALNSVSSIQEALSLTERAAAAERVDHFILPPIEYLNDVCRQAAETIGTDFSFLSVVTSDRQVLKAGHNLPDDLELNTPQELTYSMCAFVVAYQEPIVAKDTHKEPVLRSCLAAPTVRGYLGVPVRYKDSVIGALGVGNRKPFAFQSQHTRIMEHLVLTIEENIRDLTEGADPASVPGNGPE